jgi:Na+-transporting methylmalonyl-CoA/oxaloacetate decarboxylase gamma subunit
MIAIGIGVVFLLLALYIYVSRMHAAPVYRRWAAARAGIVGGVGAAYIVGHWSKLAEGLVLPL